MPAPFVRKLVRGRCRNVAGAVSDEKACLFQLAQGGFDDLVISAQFGGGNGTVIRFEGGFS